MSSQPSVEPDSKFQLPHVLPHAAGMVWSQAQPPPSQWRLAPHVFPQLPQLLLSLLASTHTLQHLPLEHCTSLVHAVE